MSAFSLEKMPFTQAHGDEFYFSTPALVARRDELCGAIACGHVLLVDEEASGKSTMLDSVGQAVGERWRIFRLQADAHMRAKDFVHELVSVFGLPTREPAAAELRDADALLELLTARSQIAVVVIDDAHRLERSALDQLLYLSKRWHQYGLRFLVCAEPSLMEELESRHTGERFTGKVAAFGMPRFDREQVGDYLHMCLFRAGLEGDSPFDPDVVAMVTEKARGLVGAISPIASELLDLAAADGRIQNGGRRGGRMQAFARRWPVAMIAAAGLGVLVTVAVPESSRSQAKVESRHQVEGFRSTISLAPRGRAKRFQRRSASADSLGP